MKRKGKSNLNKYFEVVFKSKKKLEKEEKFIVSQDLISRGIIEDLFIKVGGKFTMITDKTTVIEWIELSDDKQIYDANFNVIGLNDINFEDYIKIYNTDEKKTGHFIIKEYVTYNGTQRTLFLSMKTDDLDNKTYCEYYDKTSNEFIYTERILGLDKVIDNEQLKNKVKDCFVEYKKENL